MKTEEFYTKMLASCHGIKAQMVETTLTANLNPVPITLLSTKSPRTVLLCSCPQKPLVESSTCFMFVLPPCQVVELGGLKGSCWYTPSWLRASVEMKNSRKKYLLVLPLPNGS